MVPAAWGEEDLGALSEDGETLPPLDVRFLLAPTIPGKPIFSDFGEAVVSVMNSSWKK